MFCGLPNSRSHEYMYSSSSRHNLCSFSEALTCGSFTCCCIASRSARACVTVFNLGVVRHAFRHLEYLSVSFGTLPATFDPGAFLFFSFTSIPSSSTLWEISFHLARGFELFHLSCELCPASSTADGCQLDLNFQSFDDHPACLRVVARLSAAMFFLTFDTGFRPGEDEDGEMETRVITLETKGATNVRDFFHLYSSERSSSLSPSCGRRTGPLSQTATVHLSVYVPIFLW